MTTKLLAALALVTFLVLSPLGCSSSEDGSDTSAGSDTTGQADLLADTEPSGTDGTITDTAPPEDTPLLDVVPVDTTPELAEEVLADTSVDLADTADDTGDTVASEIEGDVPVDTADDTTVDIAGDTSQDYAFGTITGSCGAITGEIGSPDPSFFVTTYTFDEVFDPLGLSDDAMLRYDSENAGGSSMCSEVMSIQVLGECEGASLYKMETEVVYDSEGAITDYVVIIDGQKVGVSVTRAYKGPYVDVYTEADAVELLEKKLQGIIDSSQNVSADDAWVKQILHVWTLHTDWAVTVQAAYGTLSDDLKSDTIVLVTVEENSTAIVPDDCGL